MADHLERRLPHDFECRLRARGGGYFWFHCRGQAVWDEGGRPVRMAGSISDINRRKLQEAVIGEQVRLAEFGRDIALVPVRGCHPLGGRSAGAPR